MIVRDIHLFTPNGPNLTLIVGPSGSGKTHFLKTLALAEGYLYVNFSYELSKILVNLGFEENQKSLQEIIEHLFTSFQSDCILLDNLELIFAPEIAINPLRLLVQLSRHQKIIASWNGGINGANLIHAYQGHNEYRTYPICNYNEIMVFSCH